MRACASRPSWSRWSCSTRSSAWSASWARGEGGERHGPRAIDIDVLLLGDLELRGERMTLPHEQLLSRRFVLIPALELDFETAVPDGRRLSDALAVLPLLQEGVRWAGPSLQPALRAALAPARGPALLSAR